MKKSANELSPSAPRRSILTVTDVVPFGQHGERGIYALILQNPEWKEWKAGQFVMLRPLSWGQEFTWARPFSICRVSPQGLTLFFQAVGRGTERLAALKPGEQVLIWGPLGTSFAVDPARPTLLLAGGIGVAPFYGYLENHPRKSSLHMIFSHRLSSRSYPVEVMARQVSVERIHEHTPEDVELTIAAVRRSMRECAAEGGMALACGPMPFLRFIWEYALELDLPTQLSLENRMACGVGACLGCVATTSAHWADAKKAGLPVQTCTSGPVFWAKDLNLGA